jgi:MSHA pilin protein MshD
MMHLFRQQAGVTFVELVISIVVIGIAATGILQVMTINTASSADPMIRHQAIAIAEAYLDEILAKNFTDPGGPAETGRADYDDVQDYDGLSDTGARDQGDNAISGLGNYDVGVTVTNEALGPGAAPVNALRVTVTVTPPDGPDIVLSGYRANY